MGQSTGSNSVSSQLQSQPFTTDTDTAVASVEVYNGSIDATAGVLVRIAPSASGGEPDLSSSNVITLTNPGTVNENAINTYSAQAGTVLAANTTYHVVTSAANGTGGTSVGRTNTTVEDSNPAAGWNIGNNRYFGSGGVNWSVTTSSVVRIRINGPATDTTARG